MLTFDLTGRCQGCDTEVNGQQLSWTKRVNLGSIVIDNWFTFFRPCACDRNQPPSPMEVLTSRMTDESKAAVETARDRIRARRKKTAA